VEEVVVGIELVAWPNPSDGDLNVILKSFNAIDKIDIHVFDINGRYIYHKSGKANQTYQFGASLQSGLYFINVVQGNVYKQVKFVKY
jgi:hypothetical protein